MRWDALIAMLGLIALAIWLVARDGEPPLPVRDGAATVEVRVGQTMRGVLERDVRDGSMRVLFPGGRGSPAPLDEDAMRRVFGGEVLDTLFDAPPNWLFRILNITSWHSLAWVLLGFVGQLAFFLRMAVQWVASERRRDSVVPEAFWWLSLGGAIALFTYFVWRKEIVGVLGQAPGIVVYARNLRLIHKRRRAGA